MLKYFAVVLYLVMSATAQETKVPPFSVNCQIDCKAWRDAQDKFDFLFSTVQDAVKKDVGPNQPMTVIHEPYRYKLQIGGVAHSMWGREWRDDTYKDGHTEIEYETDTLFLKEWSEWEFALGWACIAASHYPAVEPCKNLTAPKWVQAVAHRALVITDHEAWWKKK